MADRVEADVRGERRSAIQRALVEVTQGERVRLSATVSVPASLLRRLHPSVNPASG